MPLFAGLSWSCLARSTVPAVSYRNSGSTFVAVTFTALPSVEQPRCYWAQFHLQRAHSQENRIAAAAPSALDSRPGQSLQLLSTDTLLRHFPTGIGDLIDARTWRIIFSKTITTLWVNENMFECWHSFCNIFTLNLLMETGGCWDFCCSFECP